MFLDPSEHDHARKLSDHWLDIRREFDALPEDVLDPWHDRHLYDAEGWKAFGLYAFGWRIDENCARCPGTARLVETIPGLQTAGFSRLAPRAHIRPHRGLDRGVLRCHLGLHVPDDCELRVGDETRSWREGEWLVFDDTDEHEAWNQGETARVVLLLDFKREPGAFHPTYALLDWVDRTRFRLLQRWQRRAA